jgi:hypothetical protein
MGKKNNSSKNVAEQSESNIPAEHNTEPVQQTEEQPAIRTLTFGLARITPNGVASYELAGLRGSIYVTKSMWAGEPPASITFVLNGANNVPFAEIKAGSSKTAADPEAAAKKAAKLEERASKAAARAEKAQTAAKKALEQVARIRSKQATPAATEPVQPATEEPAVQQQAETEPEPATV